MFDRHHLTWKFCDFWDELNDWLPFAEDLAQQWASQEPESIEFRNDFEIRLATFMLADGLLPPAAQKALGSIFLDAISEAYREKLTIESLSIQPPPRGRRRDDERFIRQHDLRSLLDKGVPKSEAYKRVGEKYHRSADTIRREYERSKHPREK